MTLKQAEKEVLHLFLLMIALFVIALFSDTWLPFLLGLPFGIGACVIAHKFMRCPHCRKRLRMVTPHCPHCGKPIA